MTLYNNSDIILKYQILEEETFSTYSITTYQILNLSIQKEGHKLRTLDFLTYYILIPLKLLPIML